MVNVLVTGGAGFIGSSVIRHLLENQQDIEVTNFDCLTYAGNLESLEQEIVKTKKNKIINFLLNNNIYYFPWDNNNFFWFGNTNLDICNLFRWKCHNERS